MTPSIITINNKKYSLDNDESCYNYLKTNDYKINIKFKNIYGISYIKYIYIKTIYDSIIIDMDTLKIYKGTIKNLKYINQFNLNELETYNTIIKYSSSVENRLYISLDDGIILKIKSDEKSIIIKGNRDIINKTYTGCIINKFFSKKIKNLFS
tara:strand:+ start:3598 stop:4056 length:459 start_codon:yes stop_codon:yes gene_type:complete